MNDIAKISKKNISSKIIRLEYYFLGIESLTRVSELTDEDFKISLIYL